MKNRVLSVHQEHELLLNLEKAGLNESDAQALIESKGNALAHEIVKLVKFYRLGGGEMFTSYLEQLNRFLGMVDEEWFSFTTTASSLRELRDLNPELFQPGNVWWLSNQPFAARRGQAGRKLQLRTSAATGSFSQTFTEQLELLSDGEFVPTVRDLVEGMIAYYRQTGRRLFSEYWVRTQDVSSYGYRVYVRFDSDGVFVDAHWGDSYGFSNLGLAAARKS